MSYLKKGLLGVILIFTATTLGNIAGYFVRLILARNITLEEIGLFYSVFTLITFVLLFVNIGTTPALIKFISQFKAEKNYGKLWYSIKFVTIIKLFLAVIASLLIYFSSNFLALYYFKDPAAQLVLQIFSIVLFCIVVVGLMGAIFQGFQSMMTLSLILFSENLLFLLSTIVLIFYGFEKSALLPSYGFLAGWGFTILLFLPFLFRYKKFLEKDIKINHLSKKIMNFALASFLISLGNLIIGYLDTLILTFFRPLSEVGVYNVVLPTVIIIGFLSRSISQVFFPMVSELWTKGLKNKLIEGTNLLHKYSMLTVIPLSMTLFVFPEILLNFLFGAEYVIGSMVMRILSVGIIFFTIGTVDQSILSGIGKPKVVTKILLLAALFNVVTNFIFIPYYGMLAASITTTLSYLLIFILTTLALKKHIQLNFKYLDWLKYFSSAVVFVLSVYLLKNILKFNAILEFFICLVFASLVYLIVCYLVGLLNIKEVKFFIKSVLKR